EVLAERKQVVTSLGQPMSDADFIKEYGTRARNLGFHSLASSSPSLMRNTLKVVVDRTTTLKEGDNVALRLLETAKVQGLRIPRQSRLIASAKIEGNRMHLLIKSIEVNGHIIAVKLSAYDIDGQEGVYIPGSEDINALKEVGANIGGSMGTSFTFASSAKDQIISEAARGVMQGASQLLQKKLRTIKVTLKGGYRLFLVQSK
ncbi:conjugative transposon protein TraM, partial [Hoylesella timonensis]